LAFTNINSEDRLVQKTFADHLEQTLGWESVYAWNDETFGPVGTLGRTDTKEAVLVRDLRAALVRLNQDLPGKAIDDALRKLTQYDVSRSMVQHNREFYTLLRNGVPVEYLDAQNRHKAGRARVIDFDNRPGMNRFLVVRELKLTGKRTPNYNRRADLVCFVNGLPLVFIELKAVYKNIRAGFDGNLRDYMDESVIAHAFHHNAFLIVSNGDRARYGSITSEWEHFNEWKRLDEVDKGSVDAEVLLNGMLAQDRLLDIVENFILFDESKPGATRKVVARNHQVLGVNRAVASVVRQEELKSQFPPGERLRHRVIGEFCCQTGVERSRRQNSAKYHSRLTTQFCYPCEHTIRKFLRQTEVELLKSTTPVWRIIPANNPWRIIPLGFFPPRGLEGIARDMQEAPRYAFPILISLIRS
jgi:type I restriction enzyme R subunit